MFEDRGCNTEDRTSAIIFENDIWSIGFSSTTDPGDMFTFASCNKNTPSNVLVKTKRSWRGLRANVKLGWKKMNFEIHMNRIMSFIGLRSIFKSTCSGLDPHTVCSTACLAICRWVIIAWSRSRSFCNCTSNWVTTCICTLACAVALSSKLWSEFRCLKIENMLDYCSVS